MVSSYKRGLIWFYSEIMNSEFQFCPCPQGKFSIYHVFTIFLDPRRIIQKLRICDIYIPFTFDYFLKEIQYATFLHLALPLPTHLQKSKTSQWKKAQTITRMSGMQRTTDKWHSFSRHFTAFQKRSKTLGSLQRFWSDRWMFGKQSLVLLSPSTIK